MGFNGKNGFGNVSGSNIVLPVFDDTNVVYDFDFQETAKQTLRDSIYLEDYTDRGLTFAQATASKQPTITSEGVLFDGVDDFLTVVAPASYPEVWIVLKNQDSGYLGYFYGIRTPFAGSSGALADPRFGMFANDSTTMVSTGQLDENRINNVVSNEFAPINTFKIWSAERATYNRDNFTIGAYNGALGGFFFWNGTIKRLLVFDTILSEERKAQMKAYLKYKYSL